MQRKLRDSGSRRREEASRSNLVVARKRLAFRGLCSLTPPLLARPFRTAHVKVDKANSDGKLATVAGTCSCSVASSPCAHARNADMLMPIV